MLTRNLAERLVKKFGDYCKIEGDNFIYNDLAISIGTLPITVTDLGSNYTISFDFFGSVIIEYFKYEDNELGDYLVSLIDTDEVIYGETPILCWYYDSDYYPLTIELNAPWPSIKILKDFNILEGMIERGYDFYKYGELCFDFPAIYKYYTGKDWENNLEELVPRYSGFETISLIQDGFNEKIDIDKYLIENNYIKK